MRIVISGGGTGGHFFPAVTLIKALQNRKHHIMFIGTKRGIEYSYKNLLKGTESVFLEISNIMGTTIQQKLAGIKTLATHIPQTLRIIKRFNPNKIVTFGGYASLPAGIAAILLKIDLIIHEQNAIPGKANLILSKFAKKILAGNKLATNYMKKAIFVGNPIREETIDCEEIPRNQILKELHLEEELFTILVMGGSQGALKLNEAVINSLPFLKDVKDKIQFIHITGKYERRNLKEIYNSYGIKNYTTAFMENPCKAYKVSDAAISRAGALAVSELCCHGIPTIFIPYPFSKDNHQFYNVKNIHESGGCFLFSGRNTPPEKLAGAVKKIQADKALREKFRSIMKNMCVKDATESIIREIENE